MKMAVFDFALRKKGVYGVLHIIILLLSLFLVISISIDTFKNIPFYTQTSYKKILEMYLQPIITQYFIDNKSEIWLLFLIAHSKR